MSKVNLYIVRHAETFLNRLGSNQGWIDSDLTDEGIAELNDIYRNSDLPPIDAVYCSDLGRAQKTFDIMKQYLDLKNVEQVFYTNLLRERFLGSFEGTDKHVVRKDIALAEGFSSYEELLTEKSLEYFINCTKKYDPDNLSENFAEFSGRLEKIISRIKKEAKENNWEHILIVAHANPVSFMTDMLLDTKEFNVEENKVKNGELVHLQSESDLNSWTLKK